LWNGESGDRPGGTRHMMEAVRNSGGRTHWLDTTKFGAVAAGGKLRIIDRATADADPVWSKNWAEPVSPGRLPMIVAEKPAPLLTASDVSPRVGEPLGCE